MTMLRVSSFAMHQWWNHTLCFDVLFDRSRLPIWQRGAALLKPRSLGPRKDRTKRSPFALSSHSTELPDLNEIIRLLPVPIDFCQVCSVLAEIPSVGEPKWIKMTPDFLSCSPSLHTAGALQSVHLLSKCQKTRYLNRLDFFNPR
jgi:hypothetical protein